MVEYMLVFVLLLTVATALTYLVYTAQKTASRTALFVSSENA